MVAFKIGIKPDLFQTLHITQLSTVLFITMLHYVTSQPTFSSDIFMSDIVIARISISASMVGKLLRRI